MKRSELSDKELLCRIKDGDERSFRVLFDRYYSQLSLYAVRIVDDVEEAVDVVQSLFVEIYEHRENIDVRNVRSFLYQSVHNRCINHIKYTKVREDYQKRQMLMESESYTDIEEKIDYNELQSRLYMLIDELPEGCRKVFIMSRLDGKTNDEISEEIGISKRTVETHISHALKYIRERLSVKNC